MEYNKYPKFHVGAVYDMSLKCNSMPNRIKILMVYMELGKKEWYYNVRSENTQGCYTVSESNLICNISKKFSKCYKDPSIIERYAEGYRYCGYFSEEDAVKYAEQLSVKSNIERVRIYPALSPDGNIMKHKKSVWIKYYGSFSNLNEECNIDAPYIQIK